MRKLPGPSIGDIMIPPLDQEYGRLRISFSVTFLLASLTSLAILSVLNSDTRLPLLAPERNVQ